jgi:hypothetical protein
MFNEYWIGFQYAEQAETFSSALDKCNRVHPPETRPMSEYLASPDRNPMAVRLYYERLARDYQAQADLFQAKADECLRAATSDEP